MLTVSRLEVITEIVVKPLAPKLMQRNLLEQFGDILQGWHRSVVVFVFCFVRLLVCFVFNCLHQGHFYFRRGVTTASLNCRETDPDNSHSFTFVQIKGAKSFKYFFNNVVGVGSKTQLFGAESHISLRTDSCDPGLKPHSSLPAKKWGVGVSSASCESGSLRIDAIYYIAEPLCCIRTAVLC